MEFFSSPAGIALLSVLFGVLLTVASTASFKAATSPRLEKIKSAYPVLNMVLTIAATTLSETKYGVAVEAAQAIWQGQGFSPKQARKYADAMIDNLDLDKYIGTDLNSLTEEQIKQGEQIARQFIPEFTSLEDVLALQE